MSILSRSKLAGATENLILDRTNPNEIHPSNLSIAVEEIFFASPGGIQENCNLDPLLRLITSNTIVKIMEGEGIYGARIDLNHFASSRNPLYDRFLTACAAVRAGQRTGHFFVRLVFHGTPEHNVYPILQNGLDPSCRRGQAFGPGEYFATSPWRSVGYCRGGKMMLVFAVLVEEQNFKGPGGGIVVLSQRERQLPLAIANFSEVDKTVMRESSFFRSRMQALEREVETKEKEAQNANYKAKVIQLVIQNELQAASDLYKRACDSGTGQPPSWSAEISAYVRSAVRDTTFVDALFPGLPLVSKVPKKSVETFERDASEARCRFAKAKAAEAEKTKLIQLVTQNELQAASDLYKRACNSITGQPPSWSRDLPIPVRRAIRDTDDFDSLFPGLLLPPEKSRNLSLNFFANAKTTEKKEEKEKEAIDANCKAETIQLVIQNDLSAASDLYLKAFDSNTRRPPSWSTELSLYVYGVVRDASLRDALFPGLPIAANNTKGESAGDCERDTSEARGRFVLSTYKD